MMLEYEWGNPAAAAAAMMLFGEEAAAQERQVFDSYVPHHHHHHGGMGGELFYQQQQQMSAAGLFAGAMSAPPASCHQRYGLGLPPAPARIGLNLGVRTYFSSGSPDRVCRRRTRTARCQAEGCGADLTHAKHYHRRHKVCEFHSKASIVIAAGLSQRFCQQCSRFHVLAEFDQGKRSCRKRLADHNKRRRKSQDLTTTTTTTNASANAMTTLAVVNESTNTEKVLFTATATSSTEPSSSVTTRASSPPPAPAQPPVALALGGANFASSPRGASPPSVWNLGDFRGGQEQRFPSWDEAEDGSSIRGLFQTK